MHANFASVFSLHGMPQRARKYRPHAHVLGSQASGCWVPLGHFRRFAELTTLHCVVRFLQPGFQAIQIA